jgi:hypothetical protein
LCFIETNKQPVDLEDIPVDTSLFEQLAGKVAIIDTLFPEWDEVAIADEKWAEPFQPDVIKKINYPSSLNIANEVSFQTYFGLEPIEVAVDPKAKKEPKKDPKKGAVEVPVEISETFLDEHGRALPVVFKPKPSAKSVGGPAAVVAESGASTGAAASVAPTPAAGTGVNSAVGTAPATARKDGEGSASDAENTQFLGFVIPRPFKTAEPAEGQEEGREIDPFVCGALRVIQRFTPTVVEGTLTALENFGEGTLHISLYD